MRDGRLLLSLIRRARTETRESRLQVPLTVALAPRALPERTFSRELLFGATVICACRRENLAAPGHPQRRPPRMPKSFKFKSLHVGIRKDQKDAHLKIIKARWKLKAKKVVKG